ncbi:MAG: O-antigen ligase family protein [Alphaproteobacteria bacterium]|nr:O-antigen ligase family protein [Alphaproteobacteria bacterium]
MPLIPTAGARPFLLLACLYAPVGVIAPKALAPLLFVAALWLLFRRARLGQLRRPFQGRTAVLAGAIALWSLLSVLWALDPSAGLMTFAKLAGVLLSALILLDGLQDVAADDHAPLGNALLLTFGLSAVLLALESLSGAAAHQWFYDLQGRRKEFDETVLNRAEALLLLAVWPTALALWRRGRPLWSFFAVLVAGAIVVIGVSNSNHIATVAALAVAVIALCLGPWLQRLLALLIVAGVLAAPLLPSTLLAPDKWAGYIGEGHYSALHRLHIWQFAAQEIGQAPVLGWGMDAARRIPGGDTKLPGGGNVMSVHPHNASLQIWLELGAVGAILTAAFLALLWYQCGKLATNHDRAAATGLLLVGLVVAHLSFGVWQTWWMAALALSGTIFVLVQRQMPQNEK